MASVMKLSQAQLAALLGPGALPGSLVEREGMALWFERATSASGGDTLALLVLADDGIHARFTGHTAASLAGYTLLRCPADEANARALRAALPWLRPVPLGLATSAGFGDRLGRATPGHVRALRSALTDAPGRNLAPIFAQQSMRENARTGRTPERVLADATWGAFAAGWRGPLGADADHLKTAEDIDTCAAAGYTFYTLDPGAYVDASADNAVPEEIGERVSALPWDRLESAPGDLRRAYVGRTLGLETMRVALDEQSVLRAAAKYGRAVAHSSALYRHLAAKGVPFELEVSVDETETPTTLVEHIYIASELRRLGVRWVSLAPRYIGRFNKGVEYVGDPEALAADLRGHAEVARALGPYKLSLHSGSDKFSVYAPLAEATRGALHLKTAGTSYLEALRVVAAADPELFREVARLARERYETDRVSYHVAAEVRLLPDVARVGDAELPELLDEPNTRQALHVTFGSALAAFGPRLLAALDAHPEEYAATLERHFRRHLDPLLA